MTLEVELFTDPVCPFAFSAEPVRQRLRWHYGEQLRWVTRMIVLTREPGEAEKLAEGAPGLQARYGMPIDPAPYPRPASSEPACLAFVAARLHAPDRAGSLLRQLRVRVMRGGLADDPALIRAAAANAGIDPDALAGWCQTEAARSALEEDAAAARHPSRAALALEHKLGGTPHERRYTAPSYLIGGFSIPGFNPIEVYETAIANRAPELTRRARPQDALELLSWASEPLATAEIALVMRTAAGQVRRSLEGRAVWSAAGADGYWSARE
ncbi:MAG TPA: DsbA family protein [Solirubrobacteraceae bacterium]|nr:DsbA family protein [Solirubrobacteraceae bacterium]